MGHNYSILPINNETYGFLYECGSTVNPSLLIFLLKIFEDIVLTIKISNSFIIVCDKKTLNVTIGSNNEFSFIFQVQQEFDYEGMNSFLKDLVQLHKKHVGKFILHVESKNDDYPTVYIASRNIESRFKSTKCNQYKIPPQFYVISRQYL